MTCCHRNTNGLLHTILTLPSTGWYYGDTTVAEAEALLQSEPNGAFLVRDSSDSQSTSDLFTITFKIQNRFGSVRVDYAKGYFSLSLQDPGLPLFHTLMDLIAYCQHRSTVHKLPVCILTGHRRNHDVHLYLTKPVSRHRQMHSLQYFCRQAIHGFVTRDRLEQLGLPRRLVEFYLSQNPYFDEQLHPVEEEERWRAGGKDVDTQSAGSRNSLQLDTGSTRNQ
jgi:suppressor of cytokine signaling 7